MQRAFSLLPALALLLVAAFTSVCSAQDTQPYSPGRGGTALTPTALAGIAATEPEAAPAPDAAQPEPPPPGNDDGNGQNNGPPPYTVLAAIIVGAGLCISVVVCLCVRRLAVITHSRRLAQASDVAEVQRRRTRHVAMTALGRYSASRGPDKPLAPVHVVVMPDKSLSFGVELTKTGKYVSSDLAVQGPAAEVVAAAGELSGRGGGGTVFEDDVTGGGGGEEGSITISRFRVHRPAPPPDLLLQAAGGPGAAPYPGANPAAEAESAAAASAAAAAATAAAARQTPGQRRVAGAWQQLSRGSSRIMYGAAGDLGTSAQAAALDRASGRGQGRPASREPRGGSEAPLGRISSRELRRSDSGGGGRGLQSAGGGVGSSSQRGAPGSTDAGVGSGGGAGQHLQGGSPAPLPGSSPPHGDDRRHSGGTVLASPFEPAAAAGPAWAAAAARAAAAGSPSPHASRRSLSAPSAADAEQPEPALQPRHSGDLRQRYGLPGSGYPEPPAEAQEGPR